MHFNFDANSLHTSQSRLFAEILSKANANTREEICTDFGFHLSFDSDGIRLEHDGRKVGFGGFDSLGSKITFSVYPKVENFDLRALFDCIQNLNSFNKIVTIKNSQNTNAQDDRDMYSWTFLLGLLSDINEFGTHHFSVFNSKKVLSGRRSVVGRPIAKSLVQNFAKGRLGIDCEVLDNFRQRQYASLLLATAKSVLHDLRSWSNIIYRSNVHPQSLFNSAASKLKTFADIPFTFRLVTELSRPPYAYGVQQLVTKCCQYWKWKGFISSNNAKNNGSFWTTSIALDKAFEIYAGEILADCLAGMKKIPKRTYSYSFDFVDERSPDARLSRSIEPDHIYTNSAQHQVFIAEVKYSNSLAVREHVSQIISYLTYENYPFNANYKTGLLIYPGMTFNIERIPGFSAQVLLVSLPVSESFIAEKHKYLNLETIQALG